MNPPGSYYRSGSGRTEYFWHSFDQVLLRSDLLDFFRDDSLEVVTRIGERSLVKESGLPDPNAGSDHLPLLIELSIEGDFRMAARNPWQKLKDEALKIRTPTQILREQAGFLSDATDGVLRGEISTEERGGQTLVTLSVYAPTLNNYSVDLLKVRHPVVQYPATLYSDWMDRRPVKFGSPEELEPAVLACLEGPELQRIVAGLFAQTGGARN